MHARRYYIEPECLVIRGVPSAELAEKLQADEKLRMENQIKKLGPEGLIHAARVLEEAKAEHAKSIPKDILAAFPVPKVKSISWIPVQSVQEVGSDRPAKQCNKHTELSEVIESDGKPLSFFVQYDHVASDFVTVNAFFSMHNLPNRLRPYIVLTYKMERLLKLLQIYMGLYVRLLRTACETGRRNSVKPRGSRKSFR